MSDDYGKMDTTLEHNEKIATFGQIFNFYLKTKQMTYSYVFKIEKIWTRIEAIIETPCRSESSNSRQVDKLIEISTNQRP